MYSLGDKVVCMDEDYPDWALDLYDQLPMKGKTYTIRNVSIGRSDIDDQGTDSLVVSYLLNEITNRNDPHFIGGKEELRFNESHFMLLEEFNKRVA